MTLPVLSEAALTATSSVYVTVNVYVVAPLLITSGSDTAVTAPGVKGDSNAPTSGPAPTNRGNPGPRSSVTRLSTFDPRLIARLPVSNACVGVGPPLSASGASRASITGAFRPPT